MCVAILRVILKYAGIVVSYNFSSSISSRELTLAASPTLFFFFITYIWCVIVLFLRKMVKSLLRRQDLNRRWQSSSWIVSTMLSRVNHRTPFIISSLREWPIEYLYMGLRTTPRLCDPFGKSLWRSTASRTSVGLAFAILAVDFNILYRFYVSVFSGSHVLGQWGDRERSGVTFWILRGSLLPRITMIRLTFRKLRFAEWSETGLRNAFSMFWSQLFVILFHWGCIKSILWGLGYSMIHRLDLFWRFLFFQGYIFVDLCLNISIHSIIVNSFNRLHFRNILLVLLVKINIYNIISYILHFFKTFLVKHCQCFQRCFKQSLTFNMLDNIEVSLDLFDGLFIKSRIWTDFVSIETAAK